VPERELLALMADMTIARDAFLRALPGAVAGAAYDVDDTQIRARAPGPRWRIALEPLPDLAIGALRLPRLRVSIFLTGYSAQAARGFVERFELYFRRAGG
jgi:hypothetical protein